ncbi:hypothetical protein CRUP_001481 [Coryphaenoides rupestris]|nr:hypothetical protein CRUP_001481 [Coryphaenoides rupestris]
MLCVRVALRAAGGAQRRPAVLRQTPALLCSLRLLRTSPATPAEALAVPPLDGAPKQYAPKIQQLVSDIAGLTLLEAAEEDDDLPAKKEKTMFTVKLTELTAVDKVKLIKAVKSCMEGLNLVQAKKMVESLPQDMRVNVSKEEAEKVKAALEAAGGTVVLE